MPFTRREKRRHRIINLPPIDTSEGTLTKGVKDGTETRSLQTGAAGRFALKDLTFTLSSPPIDISEGKQTKGVIDGTETRSSQTAAAGRFAFEDLIFALSPRNNEGRFA